MIAERNILDLCRDPSVFGPWFRDPRTWAAWMGFLAALFALPMERSWRAAFKLCTDLDNAPQKPITEAWLIVGRRGGKSFILALIAVFLACFRDWRPYLSPGERGVVMVIATDRRQARVIMRYVKALLRGVPMLAGLVEREATEVVDLTNRISVEIHTCNFRVVRGYTVVAALLDEVAFWRSDDSANPDREILDALRPAMATIPGAVLLAASSPYAKRGVLFEAHRDHFGQPGPVLVWHAPTRTMNPSVPPRVVEEAFARDSASAMAEFGAQFRSDIEGYVSREAVDACVAVGRQVLGPMMAHRYTAFCDPSGGSRDSMTLAIGHREDKRIIVDLVQERRAPFNPDDAAAEFAEVLKAYRLRTVKGDRYAGEWPRSRFSAHGVTYDASAKPKSDLYRDLLPMINAGTIELPDHPRLISQICSLERRTARSGKDSIDHGPGGHDDLANAVAGVAQVAANVVRWTSTECLL